MELRLQKKLASKILKVSKKKIKFDAESLSQIKEAITRSDVKSLIGKKIIDKKDTNEQSRARARIRILQKRKGRRKGRGTKKGTKNARLPGKTEWIRKIRVQREFLRSLREGKFIDSKTYKSLYMKAKGGFFRSRRHIKMFVEERNLIKNGKK
ncbi:50S ribosomal protein L19e [Candidatus Woesearchaeota archaeon]|nr:50S ribosomal protein L19e [Candidatus Woesearchaeota archaeon]